MIVITNLDILDACVLIQDVEIIVNYNQTGMDLLDILHGECTHKDHISIYSIKLHICDYMHNIYNE